MGGDARARVESGSGEGLRTQYHNIHTYFVTYSHNSGNKHISPPSTDGERIESRRGRRDRGGGGLILHGSSMTSACKSAKRERNVHSPRLKNIYTVATPTRPTCCQTAHAPNVILSWQPKQGHADTRIGCDRRASPTPCPLRFGSVQRLLRSSS